MRLDCQTPAFKALTAIVERLTSRKVTISSNYYEWTAPVGQVRVPNNDVEGLLHELCHWLVAKKSLRAAENYGLEDEESSMMTAARAKQQHREEKMCGFIEEDLCNFACICVMIKQWRAHRTNLAICYTRLISAATRCLSCTSQTMKIR